MFYDTDVDDVRVINLKSTSRYLPGGFTLLWDRIYFFTDHTPSGTELFVFYEE